VGWIPGSRSARPGPRRVLLEDQILDIVPVSRSTLWRMERAGKFPKATYISANRRVWFEDEIVARQNSVDEFNPQGAGQRTTCQPGQHASPMSWLAGPATMRHRDLPAPARLTDKATVADL
jgi:prophage regulatory protein